MPVLKTTFQRFVVKYIKTFAKDKAMLIVLLYFVANIMLSMCTERTRKIAAVIGHTVLFAFTFCLLLFCTDIPVFKNLFLTMFDEKHYNNLMVRLGVADVSVMVPFAIVELIVVLQMIVSALVFAARVVMDLFQRACKKYEFLFDKDDCAGECSTLPYTNRKLYYEYSVLRC